MKGNRPMTFSALPTDLGLCYVFNSKPLTDIYKVEKKMKQSENPF